MYSRLCTMTERFPQDLLPVKSLLSWTVVTWLSHFHGLQSFYSHQIMKIRNIKMQMYQRQDLIQLRASELLISWSASNVWGEWGAIAIKQKGPKSLGHHDSMECHPSSREEQGIKGERKGLTPQLRRSLVLLRSRVFVKWQLVTFFLVPHFFLNNCFQNRILTRPPGAIMGETADFQ